MTDDSITFRRTVSSDDLTQLKRDREESDRRFNAALTTLDQAAQQLPPLPDPPPPPDETQVSPINARWSLIPDHQPDFGTGPRAWVKRAVWKLVAPALQQQHEFNAALVEHLNQNLGLDRERNRVLHDVLLTLRSQLEALCTFESRLILFVQEITPYVDTKDREVSGILRRINEDLRVIVDRLDQRSLGLAGGLDGVNDEVLKRAEAAIVREKRFESRVADLQTTVGSLRQTSLALKGELERQIEAGGTPKGSRAIKAQEQETASAATDRLDSATDAAAYVGFEDLFRGNQEEIRARVSEYVPDFEGASDVLDVGCGRGEFLDVLKEHGISARGVDINGEMVEVGRARGLDVTVGDAVGFLRGVPDESLGGLFAAQVVEHLPADYLVRFLGLAYQKMRPGSKLVLETINPTCWFAFFDGYIRDITHAQPLHPDTLKYLLVASGFQHATVRFSAPYPEHAKLQPVPAPVVSTGAEPIADIEAMISTVNENASKLNQFLFTHMDYAAIGERL
jgi:O-antigen chain-terminating methyltransferase